MLLDQWLERHEMRELPGHGLIFSGDQTPNPSWCIIGTDGESLMESPITFEDIARNIIDFDPVYSDVQLFLVENSGGAYIRAGGDLLVANSHEIRHVESIWIDVTDTPEAKSPLSTGLRYIDSDAVTQLEALAHIERIAKFFSLEGSGYRVNDDFLSPKGSGRQASSESGGIDD